VLAYASIFRYHFQFPDIPAYGHMMGTHFFLWQRRLLVISLEHGGGGPDRSCYIDVVLRVLDGRRLASQSLPAQALALGLWTFRMTLSVTSDSGSSHRPVVYFRPGGFPLIRGFYAYSFSLLGILRDRFSSCLFFFPTLRAPPM